MKLKKTKLISLTGPLTATISLFLSISPVFAQTDEICNPALSASIGCDPQGENILARALARYFAAFLALGAIAFLIYLVYGAFRWLTAGENKGQLDAAKSTITQSLIGLTILASVFAIATIIGRILGLGDNFPTNINLPIPTPTP